MIRKSITTFAFSLSLCASPVFAASLTPQQCHDYAAVHAGRTVTHAQVVDNLSALESVGYVPGDSDEAYYPRNVQRAERLLSNKVQRDCVAKPADGMSLAPSTGS